MKSDRDFCCIIFHPFGGITDKNPSFKIDITNLAINCS